MVLMLVPREFVCVHGGQEVLIGVNNRRNIGIKEVTVSFPAVVFFFPLSTGIWWVGLNWGLMMECELKDRGTATVLCFSALQTATLLPAHRVLFPSKHSCSLLCLAPWSPRTPLAKKKLEGKDQKAAECQGLGLPTVLTSAVFGFV